jgi:hypothetical protein
MSRSTAPASLAEAALLPVAKTADLAMYLTLLGSLAAALAIG